MFDNIMFDEEILFTYIGYAAGLATILTFAIQILRIIETKNVTNLSSYMYIIYSLGLVCWFAYVFSDFARNEVVAGTVCTVSTYAVFFVK